MRLHYETPSRNLSRGESNLVEGAGRRPCARGWRCWGNRRDAIVPSRVDDQAGI